MWAIPILLGVLMTSPRVQAQGLESVGTRAGGLAAFVAVADDASAVAWNPSGLVLGPILNITLDFGRSTKAGDDRPEFPEQAGRVGAALIAIGLPPLGLSYYRMAAIVLETAAPAAPPNLDRQNRQVVLRSLVTRHLGATVLQSLGDYITVGATAKLVRGNVGRDVVSVDTWNDGFERAELLDTEGDTTGDVDVGAMFAVGRVRAGVVVRNLTEPTFKDARGVAMSLGRQARVGVAWGDRWPGLARTIVALDADATRVPHAGGARRDIAAGAERWLRGQQIGLRGGLRLSTVREARPILTGGVSYAVRTGTYFDAYVARGRHEDRAWGVAARVVY